MASTRGPDFEPAFGSRTTNVPLEPRLRDRRDRSAGDADERDLDALQGHGDPNGRQDDRADGGSISELVDSVESHRTVGDVRNPVVERAGSRSDVLGEPMLSGGRGPVIPAEILESQVDHTSRRGSAAPSAGTSRSQRSGSRWFRLRRRLMALVGAAIVIGLLYFLVSLLQVWSTGRADDEGPVDAIVVMGAAQYDGRPSPQLAARLDHVVQIWPTGVAPLVVVTGGNIPGDRFTEAEASADYLADRGVPAEAILLENTGSNSQESLTSVSVMLTERGLDDILIVTDPYHALRSRLIAEEVGLDAKVSSTDTSVVTGFDSFTRHVREAGGVAVGRIIGFDRLSDLID